MVSQRKKMRTILSLLATLSATAAFLATPAKATLLDTVSSDPELSTCSIDNGCPMSAMAYATGSFTSEFLLSEAALQSATNMTLHLHLCCGYTIRGELLTNVTTYTRFLVELLHVSPLAHLSVKEQLAIFPHRLISLTRQKKQKRSEEDDDTTTYGQQQWGSSSLSSSSSSARSVLRYTPADFPLGDMTDPANVPDGDILTLVVAPQGSEFRLMPTGSKKHRYANHIGSRPTEAEQFGVDYSALTYSDPSRLLGGAAGTTMGGSEDDEALVTEFQMFIANFAIQCKCPHTLPVLPLLKYRRDTLPLLALEGLGAKCITNDAHTKAVGPWSRVIYSVGSQSAAHQQQQQQQQQSSTANRSGNNAMRTARANQINSDDGNAFQPLFTIDELNKLGSVTSDTVIANTFFSVAPAQLPAFTRLQWRLYEISEDFAAEIKASAMSARFNDGSTAYASASAPFGDVSTEAQLYRAINTVPTAAEGGSSANAEEMPPISIDEQNFRLRFPNETASKLLSAAEKAFLKQQNSGANVAPTANDRLRLVAESSVTTNTTHEDGSSERFAIRPNVKYLVTVDVRRGEARQVLRGIFVLRLPAWLTQPSRFLIPANKTLQPITIAHDHMLIGKQLKLDFSQVAMDGSLAGGHYRRVWSPLVSAASQRVQNEECLQKFKLIKRQHEERKREARKGLSATAGGGTAISSHSEQPEGQHSDYFEIFATAEARQKLLALRRQKLEARLVDEADKRHSLEMIDAVCRDVFAMLEDQMSKGQPLRVTEDAFAAVVRGGNEQSAFALSADSIRAPILPPQLRHLRDPSRALFAYDVKSGYSGLAGGEGHTNVLVDHLEDGSVHFFPLGTSSVGVWLVDVDGACNATRVEVANVHALHPRITRPATAESTVCTRVASLEAEGIAAVVKTVKTIFPALAPAASSTPFDATASWSCFDETKGLNQIGNSDLDRAAIDRFLKEHQAEVGLPVTALAARLVAPTTITLAASVNMSAQSTGRCFMTIKAANVPRTDANSNWLHVDEQSAKVVRPASYFTPSQDVELEDSVTIHCRAFTLPLQVFVDVDTKNGQFVVRGLPVSDTARWTVGNSAPIRHLGAAAPADANGASDGHLFELLDTDMFDIALDELSRNVPIADRTYALRQNSTGEYAYIVLSPKSLVYTINYDPSGTCPEGEVEVVVRLMQTPPAAPDASDEVYIEDPCVLLKRPRSPTPDEVISWNVIRSTDDDANLAEFFGEISASRREMDDTCLATVSVTLHDSEEAAVSGEAGISVADASANRRVANDKRYVRVCGVREGLSCAVRWNATNAAGTVSKATVIHRCRSPPTVNLYTEAPRLQTVSTFNRRLVYDDTHKLRTVLTIAGNISLFPIAGSSAKLHYRLAAANGYTHSPIKDDHTLTELGRMRVTFSFESATRFPYLHNVTEVHNIRPYEFHSNAHTVALYAQEVAQRRRANGGALEVLGFKGRIPADTENHFGNGQLDLNCPANVLQNDDTSICTATFVDLGNSTRHLFMATVEIDKFGDDDNAGARDAQNTNTVLTTQSLRVRDEFQKRRLCRTSHRPFAIYSLEPETVLSLQEHPSTRDENAENTGHEDRPLKVRFCTQQYHFVVRRELYTTLGYDFTFGCANDKQSGKKAFTVEKTSQTETLITPLVTGASAALCTLKVVNRATVTSDSVVFELVSVAPSAATAAFSMYLLSDVFDDLASGSSADAVAQKHPYTTTAPIRGGSFETAASSASATALTPAQRRQQRYRALKLNQNGEVITATKPTASADIAAAAKNAIIAVGRSVELVAYSKHVAPFSGTWHVINMVPTRDLVDAKTSAIITQGGHLSTVRIRETAADLGCADQCVSGSLTNIPTSGFYTVGYAFPDTVNPDVCPASNVTRTVHVFLAEVLTPEVVTCVPNVTIKAAPLPLAHRAEHYGKWSVVTFHTSPTDVSPFPEEFITFDNPFKDTTTVRGLRFGVLRLRWNIYRNDTHELLDSAVVTIKVLTDSLPSDRVVTFKDTAIVQTTSSTINWRAMRPNIRVSFRHAAANAYDPSISGELYVSQLPLGLTRLRYDAVRSARAAQFPMLGHLECPKKSQGDFFIERVAASLTAGTTMRVECHAYSGQGVITMRLATGGSDDIRLVARDQLQALVFNGTAKLTRERPNCRVPWWARDNAARWLNISYFDNDRAVNITVRAKEYLSQEEIETTPVFATSGQGCPESGGFISSAVIEGVPHDGTNALFVPIVDPVSARLHTNFFLRAIEGQRIRKTAGESMLSSGNASIDIALTRGASFGFRSNDTLLMMCLNGEVPVSAIAKPFTVAAPTTHRGQQSWGRYIDAAGSLMVKCEPLVFLPHGSSSQTMTIGQLESQLQVIHKDTVQTLRNRDGIDVHGLTRSTQMALAARRVTSAQLAEILHRNRRMEAERLARAQSLESDADRFNRVMRLSSSVFGDDAVVAAIRVTLPAYPPFFTTEDILLNIQVAKATVCSLNKDDPFAPSNSSGHGQSAFGQLVIEDEPVMEEVTPNGFSQCEFESQTPVFNLNLKNGAFRPDASLETCRIELIDDGVVNASVAALYEAKTGMGLSAYEEFNNGRGPISSLTGGHFGGAASSKSVGLHACFANFLKGTTFRADPLSQKKVALQLAACPQLKMIDLEEYNSYEPMRRTQFFRRMTQPHHMRVVLHNCVIPDKFTHPKAKRGFGANAYVDGVFNVVIQPTMAHLKVMSSRNVPAAQQQLVDPETSDLDRLLLCEGDVQERGALLGIELSGDRWHHAVGDRPALSSSHGGHGSRNVALLNAFSVVEKEEYLMMQRSGESIYDRRQRIARLVDSRYDTADETFGGKNGNAAGYRDLAHASSGAHATTAVKVSKFMHYMYRQFWSHQNNQQLSSGGGGDGHALKPLVTRYNDTFITIQIPEDRRNSLQQLQAYQRYSSGYGDDAKAGGVVLDSNAWGFGGVVEEVRIAIPGVTTTCNACLLTDVNFYFVGDFAGSVSLFSQRALSHRMMADRAQLEAPLRLALAQLEDDRPIVFHHHWMCPTTAAKRLQTLMDIVKGPQYTSEYTHPSQRSNNHHINGPVIELVIQMDLGKDTPSLAELHQFMNSNARDGEEDVFINRNINIPAPSALMRTAFVMRNATLPNGELSTDLHATLVMRSAHASALPSRILHELEVSLQFMPETLFVGHKAIAAAMKKRKARLGYGARPEDLAFSGVVTLRTCVNGGGVSDVNCLETASRGIVVGPWEAEVAPIVTPTQGATLDRSYVAESQRHVNRIVHSVRNGFVVFLLFLAHHIVTAYVLLRVRKASKAVEHYNSDPSRYANIPPLAPPSGQRAFRRGISPDPNSDSFNVVDPTTGGGYAAERARSVSITDLEAPSTGNTAIFIFAFLGSVLLCYFTFSLWIVLWLSMWALIILAQKARSGVTFAAFLIHFLLFLAAVKH